MKSGKAEVVINAINNERWDNVLEIKKFMGRMNNGQDFRNLGKLTVLTSDGPVVWVRP